MGKMRDPSSGRVGEVDAVIFDMDGVLTPTTSLHEQAWKRLFDRYLEERKGEDALLFTPIQVAVGEKGTELVPGGRVEFDLDEG